MIGNLTRRLPQLQESAPLVSLLVCTPNLHHWNVSSSQLARALVHQSIIDEHYCYKANTRILNSSVNHSPQRANIKLLSRCRYLSPTNNIYSLAQSSDPFASPSILLPYLPDRHQSTLVNLNS